MKLRPLPLLAALLIASPQALPATVPAGGPVQQVGAYTIYFGIMPAAIAGAALGAHSAGPRDAHGLPRGDYAREHHLLVVAERTRDPARVRNAPVVPRVPDPGQTGAPAPAPTPINGAMSYGAVFVLPGPGRYVFTTTVRVPGLAQPLVARFVYTQSHEPRR